MTVQIRDTETWSTLYVIDEISHTAASRHFDGSLRLKIVDALLESQMDGETRPEVVIHFSPATLHALAKEWKNAPSDLDGDKTSQRPLLTQFRWFLESAAKKHTYVCDYLWLPYSEEIEHQDTVHLLFDAPTYARMKRQVLDLANEFWPNEFPS